MGQHKNTMTILLAFALLMLCTTGCSVIGKSYRWRPEAGDTETTIYTSFQFLFQHGNVNWTVWNFAYESDSYFVGPPLIPIVPRFLIPPYRKHFYSSILIYINSPTDTTIIDFSRTQLWYCEGKRLQLRSVEEWESEGPRILKTEVLLGRTTIVNRKRSYMLIN